MKLENFNECKQIVKKINDIQELIEDVSNSTIVSFEPKNGLVVDRINLIDPNKSAKMFEAAKEFQTLVIELYKSEIYQLNRKLDLL